MTGAFPEPRDGVFDELTQLLCALLHVDVALVAQLDPDDPSQLRVLSLMADGQHIPGGTYPVQTGPCAAVLQGVYTVVPRQLRQLYPQDTGARRLCAEGYAGSPVLGPDGAALGVVAVMSRTPMQEFPQLEATLGVFAARAAAVLDASRMRQVIDQSRASYRTIFDASVNSILILDWDTGAILDVNRKACESTGYTLEEMHSLSADDLSEGRPPYTRKEAMHYVQLAREGHSPAFEWRRRNKDGSLHWDEVNLKPARVGGRDVLLAFARDITAHKNALEELKLREEQYRTIFESSSDAMFLWDETYRVVDVNPAALNLYRVAREQVVGHGYDPQLPDEYIRDRLELVRRALCGETTHLEAPAVRLEGTTFEAEIQFMPFTHRGRPHALSVVRDIGERRARERELQRSEARLRATVEAAFDCVIAMDQEGRVIEFNSAAERVFGCSREDAIGRTLSGLILPQQHRDAHERGLAHFRASGHGPMIGRLIETTAMRRDGTEFPVELAISVAAVPEGNIFVGHLRDISERRAAEAVRTGLEAQLRQAQKMEAVGQLTGGIAHDFNNILTSVIGYVVLGQERAEVLHDATLMRQLGQAQLAAQRAKDLIAQMLTFARRQKGDPRTLAVTPLMRQTLRLLRSTLPSSISLDAQWVDADLSGEATCVVADPVQLEQILFNLCINARDAMNGTGRITVRLARHEARRLTCASCRGVADGTWVELQVSDTGQGIAPQHLDRIFDPFFSTKAPGQGSGMGLAMVHGIVHDHGGHVLVQSTEGQGATFTVLLPPASPGDAMERLPPVAATGSPELAHAEVLLVEDDPFVGNYLQEQLTAWGLSVTLYRSPLEALNALQDPRTKVRLLLSDLTMQGMTGLQLAQEARRLRPQLPVMIVTGNAEEIDPELLRAHGVALLLHKPLDTHELSRGLERLLAAAPA